MKAQIILASASPRRRELLDQIGIAYEVWPVDINESPKVNEAPVDYVRRIAAEKSEVCHRLSAHRGLPVLGADTAVILNGRIMGKPKDKVDALAMLHRLSGQTHQVMSAVSLRGRTHGEALSVTEVTFREISEQEMLAYWATTEPADKAGCYAIQGLGSVFVQAIEGSFSGVVGLPLFETAELLLQQGIQILHE
ncbi:Maf family protein [Methylomicrobium sp. Wu6]|uniref:Maf family protein n=1 Tax=Methylomicrobium sp. Wu6 TaxID=3107928 RepID=UPI002DD634BF|nr:Maf family protein [Methylomicrobium sp. Wu6]MEC4748330.1 Maf family protein [Methylomicrobium sp. Wu6]